MKSPTLAVLVALCASTAAVVAQGDGIRVLVLPATDAGLRADLSREVGERITTALTKQGVAVVDFAQALLLEERSRGILDAWIGKSREGATPDMQLAAVAAADLVLRVGVAVEREVQQQGRYRVQDRLRVRLVGADDPRVLWNETFAADGQSFDGYAPAHRLAVDAIADASNPTSAVSQLAKKLTALAEDERTNGSLVTVGVYADRDDPALAAAIAEGLGGHADTVNGSVQQVRSGAAATETGGRRAFAEFTLRTKGDVRKLQSALHETIRKAPAPEGQIHEAAFLSSRRRLDLIVRTRTPETTLAKEVEKVVQGAVRNLFDANQDYLSGKKVTVLPTSIPSARGLRSEMDGAVQSVWNEQKRLEAQLAKQEGADPKTPNVLDVGPVTIRGKTYPTLREAQDDARSSVRNYYLSKPGALATEIGRLVGRALETASDKKTVVLAGDDEQSTALDVLKREAEIYREEGAIDPNSIAFLQRDGAQAVVLSSLGEVLRTYQIQVTVVDLNTGVALRHVSFLPESFKADLDKELGEG